MLPCIEPTSTSGEGGLAKIEDESEQPQVLPASSSVESPPLIDWSAILSLIDFDASHTADWSLMARPDTPSSPLDLSLTDPPMGDVSQDVNSSTTQPHRRNYSAASGTALA